MANALQVRNFTRLFRVLDTDRDGTLTWKDYELLVSRFGAEMGFGPTSETHKAFLKAFRQDWDNLQKEMGGAEAVSLEAWNAYHDRLVADDEGYQLAVGQFAELFLNIADTDGDGKVSAKEYAAILRAFAFDDKAAAEAFAKLDRDGDGFLTKAEITQDVAEFYRSDDPEAPGHWTFGSPD